jgi:Zn-dependent M28 family amino/carboxypeptidase
VTAQLACTLAVLSAVGVTKEERAAEKLITAEAVRAQVRYLSSDLLEGRGPATRGDALAEAYVASQLELLGLKPAGTDGGYFQPFEMVGVTSKPQTLRVERGNQSLTLKYREDFMAAAGQPAPETRLEGAELVFVGYGIVAPEFQWDDFKGVDLRGKVAVVMNNDPETDPHLFAGKTRLWYGRWDYKYLEAARHGALGALIIHTTHSAGYPWSVVQSSWSGEQFALPETGAPQVAMRGWMTEEITKKVMALAGTELDALRAGAEKRDFRPVPLGVKLSLSFPNVVEHARTANVLAVLPGSDPVLKSQMVVYTAHHDHLGVRPGARPGDDSIYNGALDNASGVAELLTIARAFAALPKAPKRSVLFAVVGAEEQGLLGSQYLAAHPPVPLRDLALDINMDGANIFGRTRDVQVVSLGKTNVDPVLAELAKRQGRVLKPDLMPDRGHFYRSDQFSFARAGVPAASFESGFDYLGRPDGWGLAQVENYVQKHYHQPSDKLTADWDFSGLLEDCALYFELGLAWANAPKMPQWTPGDEFEAARRLSLQGS